MDFSLLRAAFRRTLGASSRTVRRPRRSRRPPSGSAVAGLQVQVLEPRLALAADTGSAKPFWGNGHYYAVTHANDDWHTAYRESRTTTLSQLGITGGLAAVTSAEENAFIANYATGRSDPSRPNYGGTALQWEAFLAGADTGDMGTWEGRWQWFTGDGNPDNGVVFRDGGTDYGYSNWWSRQPDNKGNEDFLAIYPGGGWNDVVIRQPGRLGDYVTEWGRAGVEFNAGFAALGGSGTRNGAENGHAATMTIGFDRHVPSDYVDIRDGTPLIDIPITFGGTATVGTDYDMTVSGGWSYFHNGRLYVRNTQSVVLTFTPRNNDTWQAPRTITASLGGDGAENIYGISGNATSQVWIFDDEPLLSLGQGAYQFIRAPYTAGSSQTLPENNADFNTSADTLIFDTDGIQETEARFNEQGFYDSFAMRWESYVRIPETGSYRFRTLSDDGSILTVRRNNGSGVELASISDWVVGGGRGGITSPISLQQGDVVWIRLDSFEAGGSGYTHLNWDRPDGNGGTITGLSLPGSLMFLSESLARGVDRTESVGQDTSGLGFQLFANQPTQSLLNVRLASTSEAANSTVETGLAQRRTDSTRAGDDYAIVSGGSQITTAQIGLNGTFGTLTWQPNKAAGSLQNVLAFDLQVLADSYAEATEAVTLQLASDRGYGVSNASQQVLIRDNPYVLSVRTGQNPREGGTAESDVGWFTISTNGRVAPVGGLRVRYAITGGTATRNADFTAPQATLSTTSYRAEDLFVVPAGVTEARIFIAALADAIREGDETVTLELLTNVEADDQNFRFQRYAVDAAARQATLTIHDSTAYAAAVVTTPADRTGLGTVRAQLTGGQQVASFDVHVTSQPRADVVVTLATTSGSLSTQQLTFTSSNWTQPQRVTLTGLRTDQITTVSVTTASSDQQYGSLATQQRIVPSNWASELELSLWEGGVLLAAQPVASVFPNDGVEGSASRFGFELSLGSPVVESPVELLYTLSGRDGFTLEGESADVRHEPDATYRPLVLSNSGSGTAAFVNLGSLTTVSEAGEFSAQAWVRRDRAEGGDTVLEFSDASGQHQIWLGFPDSTNQPRLQLRSSSGAVLAQLTSDTSLSLNEWNHLAFSIDRNKVASLYVNGELVARQTLSSGLARLSRSSNLLGRALSSENRLAGAVRAVGIWNAARTQGEIRASLLDETASGSGLVSSLPLNNSLANGVSSAPAAVLSNGTTGNTAGFAIAPLYGLRLAVGEARVGLPLDVLDDLTAEGTKSLTLSLVGSGRSSIGGPSGTGTAELTDDDTADVEFLAAWSNLDASSSGWMSTSQFRISEADQATNTQTRLGIRLTSRPTGNVGLSLRTNSDVRVSRPGQAGGSALDLMFTPVNWDQVQELLLQGVDDSSVDGDITRQLSFQVTSSDLDYAQLAPSLSVLVLDDDTPAVDDDPAAGQSGSAPFAVVSAPSQSRITESGTDSAEFTITLSAPAERDTLVFFDLQQSNRQLFASDISITPSQNAHALTGLARFEGNTPILKVNFQSGNATTPSGYVSDSGQVFGARGNGWTYGWSKDHTNQGRDRNRNADQKLDTLVHFQAGARWELALPNGVYEVSASVGDARYSSTHTLNVEGVSYFAARPLAANSFALQAGVVTVSDGRLTLDMGTAAGGSTRINYLEIKETNANAAGVDLDGIDETSATFATLGQTGDFSATWSGYVAIPETGFYRFSVPTQGGVRLTLDGKVVIDQMIDTRATWSTDLLQLNRGDFVPFSLDYQSFNTAEPAVALHWQRPTSNNTDSVSDPVPAQALSRVDGFHLLIAQGSSSATVTVRGIDDAIDEADEALAVRLLSSRGVELVVTGQSDDTHGVSELAITLGITDRESVALAAGTVLDLGRSAAAADGQRATVARFRLSEAATVHRDRTARLRGTLAWVDEATRSSLGGSVVDLVAGADGELYQVLDRSVTLAVAGPLAADSAAGQGRYLASLTLQPTNRGSVELAAGTRLVYVTKTTEETVTLVLVSNVTLQSGETRTAVAVSTEERSRDFDLTSAASPLVGLVSRLELPEVATLTIIDDDLAGLKLSLDREGYRPVDGSRHSLVEQGDSLIRYVSLTSQPDDAVTVYLETNDASEARLQLPGNNPDPASARIAFTFTPEDWQTGQAFRIVPHDDRLVDGDQNVEIFSRTTSSDSFYAIPSAGRLDFVVRDNDTSGVLVQLQQNSIMRAGNGFINLSLTAEPTANVVVTLTPSDHQFTINDRSVGRSETLVFTPENWSTLQTVGLTAVDDSLVEDLSTSTLRFSTTSSDARFNALAVDPVGIVITDNDLPTATLELVSDGNEDGRPGRFRIRLSQAAPASAGSKGVLVNYRVTAVGLDSALPYGSDVAGRLDKIVQSPAGVSGTVRIAPGQSVSDVLVVPIADFLADRINKSVSVQLASGDGYAVAADSTATSATVQIINNIVAGMLVMTSGERILVKESGATATYQLALLSEPQGDVTVTISEKVATGGSRQLGTSTTPYATTVTFTRGNWFTPQQISVRAHDDLKI
ncbi:MAG: PA14 domain-containing protein [Planctomycetia bacterium]